jgi:hypothetical protein
MYTRQCLNDHRQLRRRCLMWLSRDTNVVRNEDVMHIRIASAEIVTTEAAVGPVHVRCIHPHAELCQKKES